MAERPASTSTAYAVSVNAKTCTEGWLSNSTKLASRDPLQGLVTRIRHWIKACVCSDRLAFTLSTRDDCYMKKTRFQVSIKVILVAALVIAAYLAGRARWEYAAKSCNARALVLERKNGQVSLYAAVWREIALEHRDDLRESAKEWDMKSAKRFGSGGSYTWTRNSDEIRPRVKRWKFALSNDLEIVTKQLSMPNTNDPFGWKPSRNVQAWVE